MAEEGLELDIPPVFEAGTIKDAFHGTDASAVVSIKERGFKPSKEGGSFGSGVYFFEGDYYAARWWVRRHTKASNPVVLRAEVNLGRTLYLNLLKGQLAKVRSWLSTQLEREATDEEAYAVLVTCLRDAKAIDSVKAVRTIRKEEYDPPLRAEIVVVVPDPKRARVVQVLQPEELDESTPLGL
jgi:hypothetical protein